MQSWIKKGNWGIDVGMLIDDWSMDEQGETVTV